MGSAGPLPCAEGKARPCASGGSWCPKAGLWLSPCGACVRRFRGVPSLGSYSFILLKEECVGRR